MPALSWERAVTLTVGPYAGVGVKLSDCRVVFSVEKTHRSSANTATVTAYNLGEHARKLMQGNGNFISLSAGYGSVQELLFAGEIKNGTVSWMAPEWVSKAECIDGYTALTGSRLARTFPAGTLRIEIVRQLGAALTGLAVGAVESGPLVGAIDAPLAVAGSVRRSLDTLGQTWGFQWSVQDGAVEVRDPATRGKGWQVAPLLSPDTGLIGTPEWTDNGLQVRSLLTPAIRPGGMVRVMSRLVNGAFKVQHVRHSGDTHGTDWTTATTCVEV